MFGTINNKIKLVNAMNIIGLFAPKTVSFLIILVSSVSIKSKAILLVVWLLKLIIDYDAAKPGHQGLLYKPVRNMEYESGELVVNCFRFAPTVVFLVIALNMNTWLLLIPGVVAVVVHIALIIGCIKSINDERKRKKGK